MLYALEVPTLHGLPLGDTEFASAQAAWEALPDAMRHRIEGRQAVFDFTGRKRAFPPTPTEIARNPPVRHPIVRTHPYTGRRCLYVMRDDCTAIEGMDAVESEAMIAALAEHIIKPAFIYRHQWRAGDVLMWDNCTVQHRAIQDYDMPRRRLMHRYRQWAARCRCRFRPSKMSPGGRPPVRGVALVARVPWGKTRDRLPGPRWRLLKNDVPACSKISGGNSRQ